MLIEISISAYITPQCIGDILYIRTKYDWHIARNEVSVTWLGTGSVGSVALVDVFNCIGSSASLAFVVAEVVAQDVARLNT